MVVEKVPTPHLMHETWLLEVEYEPGRQSGQVAAPDADEVPAEQAAHVVAPAVSLWVPARHLEHAVWPVEFEYVPEMHEEQLLAADGDAVEDPAAQSWHVLDPAILLNFPGAHGLQVSARTYTLAVLHFWLHVPM